MIVWPAIEGSVASVRSQAGQRIMAPLETPDLPVVNDSADPSTSAVAPPLGSGLGARNSAEQLGQMARLPAWESASASTASHFGQQTCKTAFRLGDKELQLGG